MTACRVEDNNATNGGGLYSEGSTPIVGSSAFIGNTADKGAGAYFFFLASATLTNVTFSTNTATSQGGGLYIELFSNVSVLNCILWNDSATSSAEIFVNGSSPILDTCVIEGGWTGLGQDNADVDPQFESPMTGDFTPAIGSPAINVGDNDAAFLPTIDCAGNTRVICTVVDLGGYEVAPPAGGCPLQFIRGDCDSDGQLSIGDPIRLLGTLAFSGSVECSQACDANADDAFDVADAVYTLSTLFVPGSPPPANPFPDCGLNPSTSPLSCDTFSSSP